jgi:acetyltransferase-like isoleucine patch superfamily enzyme
MGGDHDISKIGRFIIDITEDEKDKCNDQDVIFEDDIWVGARALILKGVIVGRGAVIGAGALVNQNVPPYSIMVGVPARPVRLRWTIQEILQHENILYPKHKRLSEAYLENIIKETLQLIDYSK